MPPHRRDFLTLIQITLSTAEKEVINQGSSMQRNITIMYWFDSQRDWIYATLLQKEYINFSMYTLKMRTYNSGYI